MLKLIAGALVLLVPFTVHAGGGHGPDKIAEHLFKSADRDGDGEMTPAEHDAAKLERYGSTFEMFDTNEDGRVTYPEFLGVFLRFHTGTAGKDA